MFSNFKIKSVLSNKWKISVLRLDLDHMKLIINDYSLAGGKKLQSLVIIKQMVNKINGQHLGDLDLWPCDLKINREHLLSMGIH